MGNFDEPNWLPLLIFVLLMVAWYSWKEIKTSNERKEEWDRLRREHDLYQDED